jgi:hypothetical protein
VHLECVAHWMVHQLKGEYRLVQGLYMDSLVQRSSMGKRVSKETTKDVR